MHYVSKNFLSQMQGKRTVYVVCGRTVSNPVCALSSSEDSGRYNDRRGQDFFKDIELPLKDFKQSKKVIRDDWLLVYSVE